MYLYLIFICVEKNIIWLKEKRFMQNNFLEPSKILGPGATNSYNLGLWTIWLP